MSNNVFELVETLRVAINQLNQIMLGDEGTSVTIEGVTKPSITKAIEDAFGAIQAAVSGRIAFETKAAMDASLAHPANTLAEVWNDPTLTNNGLYGKTGASGSGAWVKSPYDVSTALKQADLDLSTLLNGPFKALIGTTVSAALSRGTYTSGSASTNAGIHGWRSAFKHNGSQFDCVQLTAKASVAGNIRVEVQRSNGTVIASGQVWCATALATLTVPLNRVVTDVAVDEICYIAYYRPDAGALVSYPAAGAYDASDANPATYPEAYFATTKYWQNVTSAGNYKVHFRLMNLSGYTRSLSDEVAALSDEVAALQSTVGQSPAAGKTNAWPDPFFRHLDLAKATSFLAKNRWWGGTTGWSLVTNPYFNGKALQRLDTAQASPLNGPVLHMSEIDANPGDTVTILALVTGSGATASLYLREDSGADTAWTGSQQIFTNVATGVANTGVTSATPVLMRLQLTLSANTKRLSTYFTHTGSAGQTYQIVALWGFKGAAASGPAWPGSLQEVQTYLDLVSRVTIAEGNLAPTVGAVNYAIASSEAVTADSTTVAVAGSGFSSTARALVFTGWGERYLPAGVSFNAVRMVKLSRTASADSEKWRTLHVFVRTGASSHSGGTVVAIGDILVDPEAATLSNVTVILRDPVTKAVKTLTNADFSGGEYFVGVYAKNKDGGWAACGEPNGTMPNTQGNSYYATSSYTDPTIASWAVNSGNTRQAFEHLLLTNPQEVSTYAPSPAFAAALAAAGADAAPEVVVPPAVFGLEGKECNLYFDNLFLADADDYNINVDSVGSVGQQLDECWRWVPAGALTSGDLTLKVHGKRTGGELVSKTIKQRAAAASAGSGITKKVLVVGDSLINAAVITQTLLDLAGPDVMDLVLLGTRGTAPNLHEGRGGWRIEDYATAGRTYYKFTVSGVTVPPAINSSTYTNNGNTYTVQELNLVGGAGTMVCSVSPLNGAPAANGVLTRTYGVGDATIAFSAVETVSGNPFWHGGAVSFATYLSSYNVTTPDWVLIALGINDVFGQTSDAAASALADSAFNQLDTLIASIKAAGANIRIGLMPPTPPTADQSAFGNNYTTGQTRWRNKRNVLIWGRQLISKYANREAERIYVVPSNVNLDTVHGYPYQTVAANARTTQTVIRQTNSVHPDTGGYQQIADAVWAFLKYYA